MAGPHTRHLHHTRLGCRTILNMLMSIVNAGVADGMTPLKTPLPKVL